MAPTPPPLGSAPAQPWRSSTSPCFPRGRDGPVHPRSSEAPWKPGALRNRPIVYNPPSSGPHRSPLAAVVTRDYSRAMIASVRAAKARLSELLERAAAGEEVVITSAGRPKAKLVGLDSTAGPAFRVNRSLLRGRARKGRRAEALVREERDARD
jgi:prevent-host-death family protein